MLNDRLRLALEAAGILKPAAPGGATPEEEDAQQRRRANRHHVINSFGPHRAGAGRRYRRALARGTKTRLKARPTIVNGKWKDQSNV